jgi:hypothetical protein
LPTVFDVFLEWDPTDLDDFETGCFSIEDKDISETEKKITEFAISKR